MLTIENIDNIVYNDLTIHRKVWTITGITETDNGKPQYQFYLTDGKDFRTIYLDRTPTNNSSTDGYLYKLHTSLKATLISKEELRSVGSTQYWLEKVCE
jgi:hypothetical protein